MTEMATGGCGLKGVVEGRLCWPSVTERRELLPTGTTKASPLLSVCAVGMAIPGTRNGCCSIWKEENVSNPQSRLCVQPIYMLPPSLRWTAHADLGFFVLDSLLHAPHAACTPSHASLILSHRSSHIVYHRLASVQTKQQKKAKFSTSTSSILVIFGSMAIKTGQMIGKLPYNRLLCSSIASRTVPLNGLTQRNMATIATYKVPKVENENNVSAQILK